jgi:gelsolin
MGLRKQEQINLSDTNISGIGTELDKEIRKNAAATEAAWKGIGQQVGLHIWRIEQFHIKPVPKDTYGSFYTGDSYIVLNVISVFKYRLGRKKTAQRCIMTFISGWV